MSENQEELPQELPETQPEKKSKRGWLIGGCALLGVLVIAAVVLFVIFDPFGLVALIFGGGEIAAIVPDDAAVYAEMDLLAFQSEDLQEIIEAFQDAAAEVEEEPETYEDSLEESLGVTMEDISPWIGQHIGLVIADLDFDMVNGDETIPMVVIVQSRDKEEADAFIETVLDHREDEFDEDFDDFEFDSAVFYEKDDEYDPMIFGRYKSFVFFANDMDALEDVLDLVQEGRRAKHTLADLDEYQQTIKSLADNALVTAFLSSDAVSEYSEAMGEDLSAGIPTFSAFSDIEEAGGLTISVVEAGIQLQFATIYIEPDELPWIDLDMDMSGLTMQSAGMLPEETVLYICGYYPEDWAELYFENFSEDELEAFELLEDEFDVDFEDLFTSIEGEVALAVFEQDEGFISEIAEMPLGLSILIGINDDSEWNQLFDQLTDLAGSDLMMETDEVDLDDLELISLSLDDGHDQYPFLIYGTGDSFAVLSTEVENAEILIGEEDTLADSSDFQEVWASFPEDAYPFMYLDLQSFIQLFADASSGMLLGSVDEEEESEVNILEPLTAVAATSTYYDLSDRQIITIIFFIDR